jgi:ubiquinone/menaquinone biosynthesis C-methylase UbiE
VLENIEKNLELWDHSYKWVADGDEWQYPANHAAVPYEVWKASVVSHLIAPYAKDADVVEIAPGRGRWSELIIGICQHATLVDISSSCLEYCRKRFSGHRNVDYFLTTGTQLPKAASGTVDFVFSYDSFVHMSAEVIGAYLFEIARVLRIGGFAVIHHADVAEVGTHRQTHPGQRSAVNRIMVRDFAERRA